MQQVKQGTLNAASAAGVLWDANNNLLERSKI